MFYANIRYRYAKLSFDFSSVTWPSALKNNELNQNVNINRLLP